MPWKMLYDGLMLEGKPHFSVPEIKYLIEKLSKARNQPQKICKQLTDLLETGRINRDALWRLSKWCDWDDSSAKVAQAIARELFHGHVCTRLLDTYNKPIPDMETAQYDFKKWLEQVTDQKDGENSETASLHKKQGRLYDQCTVSEKRIKSFESDAESKAKCINHYGAQCCICGFRFDRKYKGVAKNLIQVHFIRKRTEISEDYQVNPVADMRPVSPNCHAIIHMHDEPLTIEQAKEKVAKDTHVKIT